MRYILALTALLALATVASADYRESFKKEFLIQPWAQGQIDEVSACIDCHKSDKMPARLQGIPAQWKKSWHYLNDVSCHNCHGGDHEDASLSMSEHLRGFEGAPELATVPEFCGKCHLGIFENYVKSGHGKVLRDTGQGPGCVTCHGSHGIQKASIDIINEQLCSQCHSYERAQLMRQALFLVEKKLAEVEKGLNAMSALGVDTREAESSFFSTHAEYRALFHAIDIELIKSRTSEFMQRLYKLEEIIEGFYGELSYRRNYSAVLFLLFLGLSITVLLILRTYND